MKKLHLPRKKAATLIAVLAFLLTCFLQAPASWAQGTLKRVITISGSNAPWGSNQSMIIDSIGNVSAQIRDVQTGQGISAIMTLSSAQLQALMDTVSSTNFFGLDSLYKSGYVDGSRIYLAIKTSNNQNAVKAINTCVGPVNRIAKAINAAIATTGIQLNYGELNQNCP